MVADETLDDPVDSDDFAIEERGPHHRVVTARAPRGHRIGLVLPGPPGAALHRPRRAPRRCTSTRRAAAFSSAPTAPTPGPDCPPDMLDVGGIPQGDYAPVPFVISSRGWAAWIENDGHGVRLDLGDEVVLSVRAASGPLQGPPLHPPLRPPRGCGRSCGSSASRRCCRSGPTGSGRAATSTRTSATPRPTTRATARTTSRSTRSCSTPRGRRNTTRGSSTRTSSRTRAGTCDGCATTASAPSSGSRRG